jgi:hypothetical protein
MTKYDKEMMMQWNSKTYCNATVMIRWLRQQYKYAIERFINSFIKRLLTLNVFFDHKASEVSNILLCQFFSWLLTLKLQMKRIFRELNIIISFILSECIDYVQVLNVAINKSLKNRISELADISYEKDLNKWKNEEYTMSDRRRLLTQWMNQTWREFHA